MFQQRRPGAPRARRAHQPRRNLRAERAHGGARARSRAGPVARASAIGSRQLSDDRSDQRAGECARQFHADRRRFRWSARTTSVRSCTTGATRLRSTRSRPTIVPHAPLQQWAARMGTLPDPSETDHEAVAFLYNAQLRESTIRTPTEAVRTRFDRARSAARDGAAARVLHEPLRPAAAARAVDRRAAGLSRASRSGFSTSISARDPAASAPKARSTSSIAAITQSDEWRAEESRTRTPLTPSSFRAVISFNRDEFLERAESARSVLRGAGRAAAAGRACRSPAGRIFSGIAAWIFDVYLNERLHGTSPTAAWVVTENAIRATEEWRQQALTQSHDGDT